MINQYRHKRLFFTSFIMLIFILLSGGCSTQHIIERKTDQPRQQSSLEQIQEKENIDPFERFNRSMHSFNEVVDTFVAEPITLVYTFIFPQFVLTGVSNFYSNMNGFNVVLNDFLQAKFAQGLSDTGRLALNTTVGIAGIFDVATYAGLEQHDEDFEQTLAVWGVPSGPYLVLPFIGPGTIRGIPATVVDAAGHPVTYLPIAFAAVGALNRRANAEGSLKFIDEAALDPYVFTRESYLQFRQHQIKDGKGDISDNFADFDEELFDDEYFEEEETGQVGTVDIDAKNTQQNIDADISTEHKTIDKQSGNLY